MEVAFVIEDMSAVFAGPFFESDETPNWPRNSACRRILA